MLARKAVMFIEELINEFTLEMRKEDYEAKMSLQHERIQQGIESMVIYNQFQFQKK